MSALSLMDFGMSAPGLAARAAIAVACWAAAHRLGRGVASRRGRWLLLALRAAVGTVASWLTLMTAGTVVSFAGGWPLPAVAAAAGVSVEAALALGARERAAVLRRDGIALATLRVALVLLAVLLLLQPVYVKTRGHTVERSVAVLLDVSASMHLADAHRSGSDVLRLAPLAGVANAPALPAALDADAPRLRRLGEGLAAESERLDGFRYLDSAALAARMTDRRGPLTAALEEVARATRDQLERVAAAPAADTVRVRLLLTNGILPRVETALTLLRTANDSALAAACRQLSDDGRRIRSDLAAAEAELRAATIRAENAAFAALDPAERARLTAAVPAGRQAWVRRTLTAPLADRPGGTEDLLARIAATHSVQLYEFARACEPADPAAWRRGEEAAALSGDDAALLPVGLQGTDGAAALQRVLNDLPAERLSSVVLLTDGRLDAGGDLQPALAGLAARGVPVSSVLIGSREPPRDAGVVRVEAPTQLFEGDKLLAKVDLKFDGLDGTRTAVRLERDGQAVDTKAVVVSGAVYRTSVELTHAASGKGIARYTVALDSFDGELLSRNNRRELLVSVGNEPIRVFTLDDRPRWEFRYLKNLFGSRNRAVRLQHLLFHPSRIDGQAAPPVVRAAADRPKEQEECTALPADANAWLPFDVVILGDVAPQDLGDEGARALRRYVEERGGTLVVIAGDRFMPRSYRSGPLADLLPLTFADPGAGSLPAAPSPFRMLLTAAGREHPILRLADAPQENARIWNELPVFRWRYPVAGKRPGATVLAYAATPGAAASELPAPEGGLPAAAEAPEAVRTLQEQAALETANALAAVQEFGAGRVLLLCFDSTWRMRYRVGDPYHHRFWGQVLRWASADKLAAGTLHARLGTDRIVYSPADRVTVRAVLARGDFSPPAATGITVQVYAEAAAAGGERKLLSRRTLALVPGAPGRYGAEIGPFEPDTVGSVELDPQELAALLGTNAPASVATGFVVTGERSGELVDVAADATLLLDMARRTEGTVVTPPQRAEILQRLGPPTQQVIERQSFPLWNSWPFLFVIVATAAAEWLWRKKLGLT